MTKQEKAALVSICTNSFLTVVKFVLASITASVALLAEAYHSFADILSSTLVFMALRADRNDQVKLKDENQTEDRASGESRQIRKVFSPGNWENKVAMGIGFLLILAAINIFAKVSQASGIAVRYPLVAALIVGFLALCSYILYRFETSVARDTESTALAADGRHAQTDMLASVLVVIALTATRLGWGLDRVAAGIIALLILVNALHVLTQAFRSYVVTSHGRVFSREIIYEDFIFLLLYRAASRIDETFWDRLGRIPGLKGPPESVRRRFGFTVFAAAIVIAACIYALSGIYILRPGEQAIVERFGRPLQKDSPVGPGLHYRWPYPVERVKKADVYTIRRLTIGYQSGDRKDLILWTNVHYLRSYSVITGEGPFLDVAMNVHYRIKDLYEYLYDSSDPDGVIDRIGYQVLREILGTRPFFSTITTDRDALEGKVLGEIQRRIDEHSFGVEILNVCFRDMHPPMQVAMAFEDVISAQEDYETYIEQAHGYRKDLLPRARSSAVTALNDAEAYKNALVAQSAGKAEAFCLKEKAYRTAKDLTQTRMMLEALEESLADVPKYIVASNDGKQKPDLWFSVPAFGQASSFSDDQGQPSNRLRVRRKFNISSEEDLIEALNRFHEGRTGKAQ